VGRARFCDNKLKNVLGEIPLTDLKEALTRTVAYFKETLEL